MLLSLLLFFFLGRYGLLLFFLFCVCVVVLLCFFGVCVVGCVVSGAAGVWGGRGRKGG